MALRRCAWRPETGHFLGSLGTIPVKFILLIVLTCMYVRFAKKKRPLLSTIFEVLLGLMFVNKILVLAKALLN